jgi:hypothetical protein
MAFLGIIFCHLPAFRDIDIEDHDEVLRSQGRGHGGQGQTKKTLNEDEGGQGFKPKALEYSHSSQIWDRDGGIQKAAASR